MKRFVTFAILAAVMSIAAISISLAFSMQLVAPTGSSKAVIITTASTVNGSTTSTSTVNAVAGSSVTVTMPNDTATTVYGAVVAFYDVDGNIIDAVTVDSTQFSDGTDCGTWLCPN